MTYITSILTAAALIASADAAGLRASESNHDGRKLQLAAPFLNALISQFTPLLADWMQEELDQFDPINFGNATTMNLGSSTFDGACPESTANLTYGVGSMTGLSNLDIEKIELISGSEDIDVSFLALDGATWEGDWIFEFSWPNITAETILRLEANLCGFPIDQTLTGSTTVLNTNVEAKATMKGETGNVLQFRASSQVNEIVVDSVELGVGSVSVDFGMAGSVVQQLNVAESLEQQVLTQFTNDIEPFVINVVNSFLATSAPFALSDDGIVVDKKSVKKSIPLDP